MPVQEVKGVGAPLCFEVADSRSGVGFKLLPQIASSLRTRGAQTATVSP